MRTTHYGGTGRQEGSLLGTTGRMVISPSPGYLATGLRGSYESHDGRTSVEQMMKYTSEGSPHTSH